MTEPEPLPPHIADQSHALVHRSTPSLRDVEYLRACAAGVPDIPTEPVLAAHREELLSIASRYKRLLRAVAEQTEAARTWQNRDAASRNRRRRATKQRDELALAVRAGRNAIRHQLDHSDPLDHGRIVALGEALELISHAGSLADRYPGRPDD